MNVISSREKAYRRGVSLVEVLVVMVIASVLLALVLPITKSLSRTRNDAKCIHNLRQLGPAVQSYIADNNGVLRSMYGGNDVTEMWSRKLLLGGYLNSDTSGGSDAQKLQRQIDSVGTLLRCPKGEIGATFTRDHPDRWPWQTYGMGMYDPEFEVRATQGPKGYTGIYEAPVSRIAKPSTYIVFADSAVSHANQQQTFRITGAAGSGGLALRHNNRAHVLFLDGHTEAIDRERALELKIPDFNIFDVE